MRFIKLFKNLIQIIINIISFHISNILVCDLREIKYIYTISHDKLSLADLTSIVENLRNNILFTFIIKLL